MKKIILILLVSFFGLVVNAQIKGYTVEGTISVTADSLFIMNGDSLNGTTQVDSGDTIIATKEYVDNATGQGGTDSIQFNKNANLVHQEGKLFYDSIKNALTYYNESEEVAINIGQEGVKRALNNTGQIIPPNTPVYLDANTFKVASFMAFESSRLIGITTESIGIGEYGYATVWGEQSGDFSSFTVGYLLILL